MSRRGDIPMSETLFSSWKMENCSSTLGLVLCFLRLRLELLISDKTPARSFGSGVSEAPSRPLIVRVFVLVTLDASLVDQEVEALEFGVTFLVGRTFARNPILRNCSRFACLVGPGPVIVFGLYCCSGWERESPSGFDIANLVVFSAVCFKALFGVQRQAPSLFRNAASQDS